MAEFKIGDKVTDINSGRKGRIIEVGQPRRGRQMYTVNFVGSLSDEQMNEVYLMRDYNISDAFERCKNHIYRSYNDFARINTMFKIENTSNNTISSLKASKTIFKAYQFKPLLKFLNSDNHKILIADEVGLGKTIEAGHIMLEMKARKTLTNVLIVCPKSLKTKWKEELKEKFNLDFKIYEHTNDLLADLQSRQGSFRAILNYEKIRQSKKDSEFEDVESFLGYVKQKNIRFSLMLCDEAHKMKNHTTQTYKGMEMLMNYAKAAMFLTATPIMIGESDLYNLLHLLDPDEYSDDTFFKNSLELNRPFLQALREIRTKKSLSKIADDLCEYKVMTMYKIGDMIENREHIIGCYYKGNDLFNRIIQQMRNSEDTEELRAKIQFDLTSMSEMSSIFSRTKKREITTDWTQAERHPFRIDVNLYDAEREIFDAIIEEYIDDNSYIDEWGDVKMEQGAALGLVTKKRQVASSVYAFRNSEEDLNRGIDRFADLEDAKVNCLINIIKELFAANENKIVVFALFKKTLKYLNIRLNKAGYTCAVIHGDVKDRDAEINSFKNDNNIQILLSSEVGSEGLDMQFCSSMVNYDLPWNPMVVEQRIGRIDRIGQLSPIVKIYNLIVTDSIQQEIYDRLLTRIGIFENSIGDLEAILESNFNGTGDSIQKVYSKLEQDLFSNKLSKQERQKKMDDIAIAIETERVNLKQVEEGLTNTLTNDSYFRNEINRILKNNSYLTESELVNYIQMMLDKALPTCTFKEENDSIYKLTIPKSTPNLLKNFLEQYHPFGDDNNAQLSSFKNQIDDNTEILMTFNQDRAFNDKKIIFINLYHPIVLATLNFFKKNEEDNNCTFSFDLQKKFLPSELNSKQYFLAMYEMIVEHLVYGVSKKSVTLYPVVYDIDNRQVIKKESVANSFYGQSQVNGTFWNVNFDSYPSDDCIEDMKIDLDEYVHFYAQSMKDDLEIRLNSRRSKRLQQLEEKSKIKISRQKGIVEDTEFKLDMALDMNDSSRIDSLQRTLRLQSAKLKKSEDEYEDEKKKLLMNPDIKARPHLISLNLVNIV